MEEQKFFFELTPEKILDAVERAGLRCTGRILALNSMENRVYEVEVEVQDEASIRSPSDHFRVVKFYRPGRWSKQQIQEEHDFLRDLAANEIPVIAPLAFDGETLNQVHGMDCFFTVFPKRGGRHPDELQDDELKQLGRLPARLHNVGAARAAPHRLKLNADTYGRTNLKLLLDGKFIPAVMENAYQMVAQNIIEHSEALIQGLDLQRIHGDCHLGNVLFGRDGFFLVDFDDMMSGPCVQDIWLLNSGRDDEARRKLEKIIEGYQVMRPFNHSTLRLIEPLRALRMIHFSAWIAKRWQDPAFQKVFVNFGSDRYWQEELFSLREQISIIEEGGFW